MHRLKAFNLIQKEIQQVQSKRFDSFINMFFIRLVGLLIIFNGVFYLCDLNAEQSTAEGAVKIENPYMFRHVTFNRVILEDLISLFNLIAVDCVIKDNLNILLRFSFLTHIICLGFICARVAASFATVYCGLQIVSSLHI